MDVIAVSDIRDVRDCGGPSEEEPAFIPNSFVVEEVHGCCWSLFTDTIDSMVCLCPTPVYTDSHETSTGENRGRVNLLLRRPQDRSSPTFIPQWSFDRNSIHFSHSPLNPGSLFLVVPCHDPPQATHTPTIVLFHELSLDGCCIYTICLL